MFFEMVRKGASNMPKLSTVFVLILSLSALLVGCQRTYKAPDAKTAQSVGAYGFLGDYSMLQKGKGEGAPDLFYKVSKGKAFFAKFDKIIVDPVTIWRYPHAYRPKDSQLADIPIEELRNLAKIFEKAMVEELQKDYQMVQQPGPGVLRLRIALAEAESSNQVLDFISTVGPITRTISGATKMSRGTHLFVGKASAEGKIIDSQTGELLIAAVDRRAGGKTLTGVTGKWDDVEQSFKYWAQRARWRLCHESGKPNCVLPKEE